MKFEELPQPVEEKLVHPGELKTDGDNPNKQSDEMFDLLCRKIQERGWIGNAIIADTDGLVADGEHRLRAAREIGLEEVPVKFIDISDEDRRLIRQEMNKISGFHVPERDALEYQQLLDSGRSDDLMDLIEATKEDLDDTLSLLNEREPESVEYEYGEDHNVYFMDCIRGMKEHLSDNSVDMVFTSPPYNLSGGLDTRPTGSEETYADDMSETEYANFIGGVMTELERVVKPRGHIFWNVGLDCSDGDVTVPMWMVEEMDLPLRSFIVWNKENTSMGSKSLYAAGRFANTWEPIFHFADSPDGLTGNRNFSVWDVSPADQVGDDTGAHPAPFPVELVKKAIYPTTQPGDVILDPFMGSGTTAVAAIFTDRDYVGFELDEGGYYEPIIERRISEAERSVALDETDN